MARKKINKSVESWIPIKEVEVGEQYYYGGYAEPFIVVSIKKTGVPTVVLKNSRTELKMTGNFKFSKKPVQELIDRRSLIFLED